LFLFVFLKYVGVLMKNSQNRIGDNIV